MTAIPNDKKHADATHALDTLTRALRSMMTPAERREFDDFVDSLSDWPRLRQAAQPERRA